MAERTNGDVDRSDDTAKSMDPREQPIEPGTPDPENVFFVLLGVAVTIVVALRGIGLL